MRVPFNDLSRHFASFQEELEGAALRVLRSGWYVLGPEVAAFEAEWADFCGVRHCVAVGNGTDALHLALRAVGVGPGDEVITVPNAAGYTGFAVRLLGAVPVYGDVDPNTWTLEPQSAERLIGERTRAIVPVHLYGAPANMEAITQLATRHSLVVVEDCAQAHGALAHGKPVGTWGAIGCFSFYPTKNLGALGDGGAVVTDDEDLAVRLRQLRQYGWSSKYCAVEPYGFNSRLDELQAALLRVQQGALAEGNERRRQLAALYRSLLGDVPGLRLQEELPGHVYHLFVIRVLEGRRDQLKQSLAEQGIGSEIHYPLPDYLQPAFADLGLGLGTAPVAEQLANEVLSLPCFPELRDDEARLVAETIRASMAAR